MVPRLVGGVMDEKEYLTTEPDAFLPYREQQQKRNACKKCFIEQSWVCDNLACRAQRGEDVTIPLKMQKK